MVDTIGFANAVGAVPPYSGRALRQLNAVSLAGATAVRPLGARSGVRPGTSTTTVTATSTTWTCGPLAGDADVMVAAEAGPYLFAFDAVTSGPLVAADASNPRVDIVYVKVTDPEDSVTVPKVERLYLAGAPLAIPSAPAVPAGGMVIANINMPKSGGGAPTVTWVAPWLSVGGSRRLGVYRNNTANTLSASPTWMDICTVTAISGGGACVADWAIHASNGSSGADRTMTVRVVCDGVQVDDLAAYDLPLSNTAGQSFTYNVESTPTVGSHTWKLQAYASLAAAVYVRHAVLTVTED